MSFDGSPAPFRLPSVTVVGRLHSIFDLASFLGPIGPFAARRSYSCRMGSAPISFMKLEKGAAAVFKEYSLRLHKLKSLQKKKLC